jgi:hypothetical protein
VSLFENYCRFQFLLAIRSALGGRQSPPEQTVAMGLEAAAPAINLRASGCDFWYLLIMEPTEEQLTALGNYRDINS